MFTENSVASFWKYNIGDEVYYTLCKGNPPDKGTVYALVIKEDMKPSYLLKSSKGFFGLTAPVEVDENCISLSDIEFKKAYLESMIADFKSKVANYEAELNIL